MQMAPVWIATSDAIEQASRRWRGGRARTRRNILISTQDGTCVGVGPGNPLLFGKVLDREEHAVARARKVGPARRVELDCETKLFITGSAASTRCSSLLAPGSRGDYETTTRTCARSPPWASRATRRRIECASRRRAPESSSRASPSTRSPTSSPSPSTRATTNNNLLIPPPRHHRLGSVREHGVPLEREGSDPTFVGLLRT